jgi:hypothetical protein
VWAGVVMTLALLSWVTFAAVVLAQLPPMLSERETRMVAFFGAVFGMWIVVWLVFVWRVSGIGVYVSADGIQVRRLYKTTTLSWPAVERIAAAPASRLIVPASNLAIWVFTYDGSRIETMLTDQPHGELRGVDGFQQALDFLRKAHTDAAAPQST